MGRKIYGCLGWGLLTLGFALIIWRYVPFSWGLIQMLIGMAFCRMAAGERLRGMIFPGVLLVVIGGATLIWDYDLIHFSMWRLMPILYGGTGIGLSLLWTVGATGRWVLIPAGILLLVCGVGMGAGNLMIYRTKLDQLILLWPLALVAIGMGMVIYWNRKKNDAGVR